jgi:hypothetical protein
VQIVPKIQALIALFCTSLGGLYDPYLTRKAGSFFKQSSKMYFGFTATASRSIFATVFAQACDTCNYPFDCLSTFERS